LLGGGFGATVWRATLLSRSGAGAFLSFVAAGRGFTEPWEGGIVVRVRSAQELSKITTLQDKASERGKNGWCFAGSISHPCHEHSGNSSRQAAGISQICSCRLREEK
jgi:hypothetical protein